MNKTDLINNISEKSGLTKKDVESVLNGFLGEVTDALGPWISQGDGDHPWRNSLSGVREPAGRSGWTRGPRPLPEICSEKFICYLQQNADAADAFNQGMSNLSSMLAYAVLMAYDFTGISSIVDIGGGQGKLLETILQVNPDMKGTVFDTVSTIQRA